MTALWCGVATYKKSQGSAVRLAAYRSGSRLVEQGGPDNPNCGQVHSFERKQGVLATHIALPAGAPERFRNRAALWSAAQVREPRRNSRHLREVVYGVPHVLPQQEQERVMREVAAAVVERWGVAADCSLHAAPKRSAENSHVHACLSTRVVDSASPGGLGAKVRVLDNPRTARAEIAWLRETVAGALNRALERQQVPDRVQACSQRRQKSQQRAQLWRQLLQLRQQVQAQPLQKLAALRTKAREPQGLER